MNPTNNVCSTLKSGNMNPTNGNIKIVKQKEPHLIKTVMCCDKGLSSKLENIELLKHLNQHSTTVLIGKPRSGKTSLVVSLFSSPECLKKVFHKVYLFQPSASGASIKNNIFDKLPPEQVFNELNYENLESVYNEIIAQPKTNNKCIILDDMASYLKDNEIQKLFKDLNNNRRHLGVSIYFLSQTYFSIPRELRKIFNNLFIFKTSKMELETIFDEQIEINKKYVLPISKLVYDKPYNFLFINTDLQTLFKNWDKIILDEPTF
jgi:hypothetical protein